MLLVLGPPASPRLGLSAPGIVTVVIFAFTLTTQSVWIWLLGVRRRAAEGLWDYCRYYNEIRTHWSLAKDAPLGRAV
jgi:hypothetical protein